MHILHHSIIVRTAGYSRCTEGATAAFGQASSLRGLPRQISPWVTRTPIPPCCTCGTSSQTLRGFPSATRASQPLVESPHHMVRSATDGRPPSRIPNHLVVLDRAISASGLLLFLQCFVCLPSFLSLLYFMIPSRFVFMERHAIRNL